MTCPSLVVNCIIIVLAFLSNQGTAATSLFKRDASSLTVNIPLTVNKDKRYVVGVNMSSSPVQQTFRFALSLNTGYSAVAGTTCDGCDGVPTYNSSASSSQHSFPGSANLTIGSATISGPFIKEDCSLHEANGTAWQYPNQTIVVANSTSSIFSDVTSGLIGLGTNANGVSGDFYDTVYGGWLVRNPSRNNFSFGMDLKPPVFTSDDDEGNGGVLHWVAPDSTAYQGNVAWSTAAVSSSPANAPATSLNASETTANDVTGLELPETDWSIEMDGWAASISGTAVANSSKAQALIEPFFSDIFFPVSEANLFYAAVPSAVKIASFVSGGQAWTVPCDTALSVAFNFAGQTFPIDQTQLIEQQSDGTCIGTIKAWPDDSVTNFMFGSNFLSALYLIYVIGRPGSGVPNSIGMAPRSAKSSGTPVGAIVGGTVGGVVFVAILVVGAYFVGRRRRLAHSRNDSSPRMDEKDNFMSNRNNDGISDESGAQYAIHSLQRDGKLKYSPTTPLTSQSTQPFLPEAQYPQSPALSVPDTLHTLSDFLAISPGTSARMSHVGEPSAGSVGSRISYNTQALGANISASRGASSYPASGAYGSNRTMIVEPYMLPPGAAPGTPRLKTSLPSVSTHEDVAGSQGHQPSNAHPASPQDIDPFSPSTASGGFILSPVPRSAMVRTSTLTGTTSSRLAIDTPAPPYTAHPISPTLVDSEHEQDSTSSRLEREKV